MLDRALGRLILGEYGRPFKKLYYRYRKGRYDPGEAFDAALAQAYRELGYQDWPPPPDWIYDARVIAIARDGDALGESRLEKHEEWRRGHEGRCYECGLDSSEDPFVEGITFEDKMGLDRPVHQKCLREMRELGIIRGD
jgi:hypothetical protein